MARRKINVSRGTTFASLLIIGVVLLFLPQKTTQVFNEMFFQASKTVTNWGPKTGPEMLNFDFSTKEDNAAGNNIELQKEYQELRAAHDNARADLEALNKQYEKLAAIRNVLPNPGAGLVLASVTKTTIAGSRRQLRINRGNEAGVEVGQYVLCGEVIVGTIMDVTKSTATVKLVTDASHNIGIVIQRKNKDWSIRKQLFGDGEVRCKVPLVPKEHDIRVKDSVYAAAKVGFLDTHRIIGHVEKAEADDQKPLLWDIVVKPVYSAEEITEVAVVVMQPTEKTEDNIKDN